MEDIIIPAVTGMTRLRHRKQRHPLDNKMGLVKEKGTKILNQWYFTGSKIDFPMEMSEQFIPPIPLGVFC